MSSDYTINDARRAERRIREACPWLHTDRHGDYGFKLVVVDHDLGVATIIFQPGREENGQERIITTDEQLEEFIRTWVQAHGSVDKSN